MPRQAKPSPEQIAMYGHIAAALRAVMHKHHWSVPDFHEQLGMGRSNTTLYGYLRCAGQPSASVRAVLMKKFGIPETELMKRDLVTSQSVVTVSEPRQHIMKPMSPLPVLSFTVDASGMARIKLDAAMSLAAASPLLRILLDAGIVPSTQGDDNGEA
jgi:transcriptional regulator with XRE-family HTH domain